MAEEKSQEALDMLKTDMQRHDAMLRVDSDKNKERAHLAEAELDRLRKELQCTEEALDTERGGRTKLESVNNQTKELLTTHAAQLNELKLEVIQKDVSALGRSLQISGYV